MDSSNTTGDTRMKVYISGPMSNIPKFNIPKFDDAAESLRLSGYSVTNPPEEDPAELREECLASTDGKLQDQADWGTCIGRDITHIANENYDAIVLLAGWGTSWGSTLEALVGVRSGAALYLYCPAEEKEEVSDIVGHNSQMILGLYDGTFLLRMPEPFAVQMLGSAVTELTSKAVAHIMQNENEVIH
jgi:hypothetical protein